MRIPNMCLVLKLDKGKVVSIANEQNHRQNHRTIQYRISIQIYMLNVKSNIKIFFINNIFLNRLINIVKCLPYNSQIAIQMVSKQILTKCHGSKTSMNFNSNLKNIQNKVVPLPRHLILSNFHDGSMPGQIGKTTMIRRPDI